jgi:putative membrane protein
MSVRGLLATAAGGLVIALAAGSLAPLHAQSTTVNAKTNVKTTAKTTVKSDVGADSKFIREVNADNMMEVSLGKLAEQKADNAAVKQFGQRMVTDHTKSQNDWTNLATKNGLTIKAGMGPRHRAKINRLQKLSGKAFDQAYMTMAVRNHKDDIDYFQKEGQAAHSAEVRDLASSTLPTLQDHFKQAKEVGVQVGADTTAALRTQHATAKKKS